MKNNKIYLVFFVLLLVSSFFVWEYIHFINDEKESKKVTVYTKEASILQQKVSNMILEKQKATMAIALSMLNDETLAQNIIDDNVNDDYYEVLVEKYKDYTHYKNIWIHIIDKNHISKYRSWSPKKGDKLNYMKKSVADIFTTKRPIFTISLNKFDLVIKVTAPIVKGTEVIGLLELISHFNSIDKEMLKFGVDSVVVLDKQYNDQLLYPFNNVFVDAHYISNLGANPLILKELKEYGVDQFFTLDYIIHNKNLVTSLALRSIDNEILGYYIMFKKTEDISMPDIDFFILKWIFLSIFFMMAIAGIINITLFYLMKKQRTYYKSIMDSSTNIIVVNDGEIITDVNKIFFKYFDKYQSLDDFKKKNHCICDFFQNDDGYLQKEMYGVRWIKYMLENPDKDYKVKIKYGRDVYYFAVTASLIYGNKNDYYSAVFTDITNEERYKRELEHLSTTDALTSIKNRHYFSEKLNDEIHRSERYKDIFSLIIFDIDHFKKINDNYGHDMGDRILIQYTHLISGLLRDSDVFSRVSGEEFMIILPNTNLESAQVIAEKLRVKVEVHDEKIPITISIGVVEYRLDEKLHPLMNRVDRALHKAKSDGRNRVVVG